MLDGFIEVNDSHAVYLLYWDRKLMYIGQSKNYLARIIAHKSVFEFNRVYVRFCSKEAAEALEAKLIRELKPARNKTFAKNTHFASYGLPPLDLEKIGLPIRTMRRI